MTKTLNLIFFFFPPPKSEYLFQQHWESEYLKKNKKHYLPPLQVKWSVPKVILQYISDIYYISQLVQGDLEIL